jgi:hypothetical protein
MTKELTREQNESKIIIIIFFFKRNEKKVFLNFQNISTENQINLIARYCAVQSQLQKARLFIV